MSRFETLNHCLSHLYTLLYVLHNAVTVFVASKSKFSLPGKAPDKLVP